MSWLFQWMEAFLDFKFSPAIDSHYKAQISQDIVFYKTGWAIPLSIKLVVGV